MLMCVLVTVVISWVHWGLGTIGGIVIGQQILLQANKKGYKAHAPLMIGMQVMVAAYCSCGISQAAPLMATTPGGLSNYVPDEYANQIQVIPVTETILHPLVLAAIAVLLLVTIGLYFALRPKKDVDFVPADPALLQEIEMAGAIDNSKSDEEKTFASLINNSSIRSFML